MVSDREILADGLSYGRTGSGFHLTYTDEASVRRALARLARAYGWAIVREEVVVPGWGRIDLVLQPVSERCTPFLIEIKLDLSKPARVRRAFQQADGYGRWWEKQTGDRSYPVLTYCTGNHDLIKSVGDAYPSVSHRTVGDLMEFLCCAAASPAERRDVAKARLEQAERELQIHRRAADLIDAVAEAYLKHEAKEAETLRAMGVDF